MSRKPLLIALLVLVIAAGAGAYFYFGSGSGESAANTVIGGYEVKPTDRVLGNRKAKVVLIEYGAPSCPHCAAFNEQVFPGLKQRYIDTGKILYIFRTFPLRPDDGAAEKIARCLPEDKYFSFLDLLFRNQSIWDVEFGVTDVHGGLVRVGRMAGMSADQVDKCIESTAEDDRINQVSAEAQSRYNVNSTPTLILNGVNIGSGGGSVEELNKQIDTELAK